MIAANAYESKTMTDNNADNPYAPPVWVEEEPVVEKAELPVLFVVTRMISFVFLVLAAPLFLYCMATMFLSNFDVEWLHFARAFGFIAAYVGLFFRKDKEWPYTICFIIACSWMIETVWRLEHSTPNPDEPGLVMIFSTLYAAFAIWNGVIALLAAICMLNCWRQRKSTVVTV